VIYAIDLPPYQAAREPRIEAVFRDADASACPQDTELGGAVAQVVGGTLADGQHLRDLLYRVH